MIARAAATGLAALCVAVFAILVALDSPWRGLASVVLSPTICVLATASGLATAARAPNARERGAWAMFAASYATVAVADGSWLVWRLRGEEPPATSLADVLYLLAFPLLLGGLVLLPAVRVAAPERLRFGLDLATAFTGAALFVGPTVFGPTAGAHLDLASELLAAGPPVGDVVLLAAIAWLLLRGPAPSMRTTLLLILVSVGITVGADLAYARWALAGTYVAGDAVDAVWMASNAIFVAAANRPADSPGQASAAGAVWRGVADALPYAGMVFGFGTLVWLAAGLGAPHPGVAFGARVLCGLVAARQAHLALQNRALHAEVAVQYARGDRLLRNVLPASIADRLLARPNEPIADHFPEATVLFADLVGFTPLSVVTPPDQLLALLDDIFSRFDRISDRFGIEKIKTIGDAYMAASGVPTPNPEHAPNAAHAALAMIAAIDEVNRERGLSLQLRVGLNTGPVVAGIIGAQRFCYDLWGDVVNTASRMESHGVPHAVHVTAATPAHLVGRFTFENRGVVEVKGKGPMETWLLGPPKA